MEEKKNKKTLILGIIGVIVLVGGLLGLTYAYFIAKGSSEIVTVTSGNMRINFTDGPLINASNIEPINESEIVTKATKKTFGIAKESATGKDIYARIDITDLVVSENFKDFDLKWALYQGNTKIQDGTFNMLGSNTSIPMINNIKIDSTTSKNYDLYIWIEETEIGQERLMYGNLSGKVTVTGEGRRTEYVDNSNVNKPVLAEGMIPVIYNGENWVKVNSDERYYDYNSLMWANAVTVTEGSRNTYMNAETGTVINMNDINSMWVWIPRYKYKIPSNMGSSTTVTNPPQIDVVFENGTNTTGVIEATYRSGIGSDGTNSNYYTHPAFRDGSKVYNETAYDIGGWDKELTGIWVGKFETSTDNESCKAVSTNTDAGNCLDVNPMIKPDVISLRFQNVSTQFKTALKFAGGTIDSDTGVVTYSGNNIYGLTSSTNTHMMKNTEWGAAAILSQSQYGKMGNSAYEGANKEIYSNNSSSFYTGRSGGKEPGTAKINNTYPDQIATTFYNSYGFYTYDDYLLNYNTNDKGNKVKGKGTGASTTGTIYGIYDMVGGANEYTMGNWSGYSGNNSSANSGFSGSNNDGTTVTGISFPERKYYDLYKGESSSIITKEKAILGDATWETMKWYSDTSNFIYLSYPWPHRGGYYTSVKANGIFHSNRLTGTFNKIYSFRSILIP